MNCNRHYQMVERMSAFQISISSRKLERTPRDPLRTGINEITVKFQNEAPGLIFFRGLFWGAYVWRGLYSKGNLRFKIEWASLLFGSKFTVLALFYFVFEVNFLSCKPPGGLYLEGRFNGGFFALPVWRAYIWRGLHTWRGLFSEFYSILNS